MHSARSNGQARTDTDDGPAPNSTDTPCLPGRPIGESQCLLHAETRPGGPLARPSARWPMHAPHRISELRISRAGGISAHRAAGVLLRRCRTRPGQSRAPESGTSIMPKCWPAPRPLRRDAARAHSAPQGWGPQNGLRDACAVPVPGVGGKLALGRSKESACLRMQAESVGDSGPRRARFRLRLGLCDDYVKF